MSGRGATATESREAELLEAHERQHLARAESSLTDPTDLSEALAAVDAALQQLQADSADPAFVARVKGYAERLRGDPFNASPALFCLTASLSRRLAGGEVNVALPRLRRRQAAQATPSSPPPRSR